MAFGGFRSGSEPVPLAEINVIPLVDIMLVLLVIFIVTAPLLTNAVKIELPKASSAPNLTKPDNVQLAIKPDGSLFWNGEAIDRGELDARLAVAGRHDPAPELHLHVDRAARYEIVADVISDASKAGVRQIGFVTDPSTP